MSAKRILARAAAIAGVAAAFFWYGQFSARSASAQDASDEAAYRLQPGDELKIQVLMMPELTNTVKIRPDGMISVMQLDDTKAAGRTVAEVRDSLAQGYARLYRDPKVAVFPQTFTNRTVYVTGEVNRPGAVALTPGMTSMQGVIEAGGLRPNSKIEEAVLLRQSAPGERKVVPLNMTDVLRGTGKDTALLPGDVIYIPRNDIRVYVGGEVVKPGLVPIEGELSAMAAIANAGGFLETAAPNKAVVIRNKGNATPEMLDVHLGDVAKGSPDVKLKPYDIVYVPKSGIGKIDKVVDLFVRRAVPLTLTGGFSYVLGGIGGATSAINCFQ